MATTLFEAGATDVVYIVDLSSYLLRAYHAVAPLSSPTGEPTHAVHGTVTMLERLFRERRPKLLAIAMDSGRKTFRKEIYPDYKANRPPAPDDLIVQIQRAEEVVRAQGLCVYKQDGVEADDLIASSVAKARESDLRVIIVSADKDLMQLVTNEVLMWDTLRNKVFGPAEVQDRFGVTPAQLGDLLALMGDSSDNIPGVPSVGPKTAATLLGDYSTLDGVFENIENIKRKKLKQTLQDHEDDARLSRRLVELKADCPVEADPNALRFGDRSRIDISTLSELFEGLGFTRQLGALRNGDAAILMADEQGNGGVPLDTRAPQKPAKKEARQNDTAQNGAASPTTGRILTSQPELDLFLASISPTTDWSLELHTTRPDAHRGPLIGIALSGPDVSVYIPIGHRYVGMPEQLLANQTVTAVFAAAGRARSLAIHDTKRLCVLARDAGVLAPPPPAHDTLLASYLIDPERKHGVEALGDAHGVAVPDYDAIAKEGRKKRPLDELDVAIAGDFAASRTAAVRAAAASQRALLAGTELEELLHEVEHPLARLLAEMEVRGVLIDTKCLTKLGKDCEADLLALEKQAHDVVGREFNVASPRQLETILFDELGLKPLKRTKTGRSTDAQTLEALEDKHELPKLILKHRQIAKLKGTYIDALPALVSKRSGRVHGAWEQAVAATGRISSTDPNLQNIPIRSDLGRKIRDAFVAPPGQVLISADYSQIELRVLAHLSRDERLVEAFSSGQDIHARTAMEIFDIAEENDVTREQRSRAKAVNFGVIYGQGDSALAKALGIERNVARSFIDAYFERYEGVRVFMDSVLERARLGEPVQSILGRRRVVPDINSGNPMRRWAAERIAMNMPIQGSAADILKLAMLRLTAPPTPGCKMVLTVHDELVFEVPELEVDEARAKIRAAMVEAYQLDVPLEVSVGSGPTWNSAH